MEAGINGGDCVECMLISKVKCFWDHILGEAVDQGSLMTLRMNLQIHRGLSKCLKASLTSHLPIGGSSGSDPGGSDGGGDGDDCVDGLKRDDRAQHQWCQHWHCWQCQLTPVLALVLLVSNTSAIYLISCLFNQSMWKNEERVCQRTIDFQHNWYQRAWVFGKHEEKGKAGVAQCAKKLALYPMRIM